MNLYICGIIDIILILLGVIFAVVGYKVGFLKKALSLVSLLMILIMGFMYAGQLAEFFKTTGIIYPSIFDNINGNVLANLSEKGISAEANLVEVIAGGLGLPEWLAGFIENAVINTGGTLETVSEMAATLCDYITTAIVKVISFGIIVVGALIITGILKILAEALRTNGLFKAIDGVVGSIYFLVFYAAGVCVVFFVLAILMKQPWFADSAEFFIVDMQLNTDKFRLSKIIYEGNILKSILDFFF